MTSPTTVKPRNFVGRSQALHFVVAVATTLTGLLLTACSGSDEGGLNPGEGAPTSVIGGGSPSQGTTAGGTTGAGSKDGGATTTTTTTSPKADGGSTGPGPSSGGTGGPGPGEHDIALAGTQVALHVPNRSAPLPLLILLHGQGDTGRNFLNVWMAKGLGSDLLIASPDDNSDGSALDVEQALRGLYSIDTSKRYVYGFSQGGAYAAFLLFDPAAASRFAAIGLGSSGLAQSPTGIPPATAGAPAVAVVIDATDPNNTWNMGKHVMEDFVPFLASRGYSSKLFLHNEGHKLAQGATSQAFAWMRQ